MAKGGRRWNDFHDGGTIDGRDNQADKAWLLGVQRKLYQWSKGTPEGAYGDAWNWVTDPRNLRCAWHSIAHNKGRRTPGVDGSRWRALPLVKEAYRSFWTGCGRRCGMTATDRRQPGGSGFRPGRPGKFRPLGIPTVAAWCNARSSRSRSRRDSGRSLWVQARTGLPRRTRTHPADHSSSQTRGGWNASRHSLSMGD